MISAILSILIIPLLAVPLVSTNSVDILQNDLNILLEELRMLNETIEEKRTIALIHFDKIKEIKKEMKDVIKEDNPEHYQGLWGYLAETQQKYRDVLNELVPLRKQVFELNNEIPLAEAKLESATISKNQQIVKSDKFNHKISIVLSETCKSMINSGIESNCPTYSQLAAYYDNTSPLLSGGFVQGEFDVYRDKANPNEWRYYDQYPYWLVIAVDPSVEFQKRSEVITIQANDYPHTKKILNCDMFSSSPDLKSITYQINQAVYGCAPP